MGSAVGVQGGGGGEPAVGYPGDPGVPSTDSEVEGKGDKYRQHPRQSAVRDQVAVLLHEVRRRGVQRLPKTGNETVGRGRGGRRAGRLHHRKRLVRRSQNYAGG